MELEPLPNASPLSAVLTGCLRTGAAVVMPWANTEAMQHHLDAISRAVARNSHAVLLLDRAGWHTTPALKLPKNISLLFLPSRSPELNPTENIWQYMRGNWLSSRLFADYDDIVDIACRYWNRLLERPWTIMSIGLVDWAHKGQYQ